MFVIEAVWYCPEPGQPYEQGSYVSAELGERPERGELITGYALYEEHDEGRLPVCETDGADSLPTAERIKAALEGVDSIGRALAGLER